MKVAGEDHVGIGTDNPLTGYTIDDSARKAQREFFEGRSKRGIAAPTRYFYVLLLKETSSAGFETLNRADSVGRAL